MEILVAKSLVLAKVRCPEAAPVPQVDRKRASRGAGPEGGEAGPSGEGAAEAGEQLEQTRAVDGGTEAAVDDLVAALQDYFSKRTRCVGQGVSTLWQRSAVRNDMKNCMLGLRHGEQCTMHGWWVKSREEREESMGIQRKTMCAASKSSIGQSRRQASSRVSELTPKLGHQ